MNLIIFGPPGAGKGTQAVLISKKYKIPAISTGDIFRQAADTEAGKKIKEAMQSGNLVPDPVVVGVVVERLNKKDCRNGFILDGFPRTLSQAEQLDRFLSEKDSKIDKVISLEVKEEGLVRRLSSRRVCQKCGQNYNLITAPPKEKEICDFCGSRLYQREDDQPATIKQRLKVYSSQTQPVLDYYRRKGNLVSIDGNSSPEKIFACLRLCLRATSRSRLLKRSNV